MASEPPTSAGPRSFRRPVAALLLFLLAVVVRLPYAAVIAEPAGDAADYLRLANSLRAGNGFVDGAGRPSAFRPPAYPLFVALFGADPGTTVYAQVVLGSLNVLLLVLAGRRLLGEARAPWVAGVLLAIDPLHAAASGRLLSETLYQSFLLLMLAALPSRERPYGGLVAGLLGGLAILTRTAALPLIGLIILWLAYEWEGSPRRLLRYLLGLGLVLSPWACRNAVILGAPVLSTQGGITLYSSYRPPQGKIFGVLVWDDETRAAMASGEVAADRTLARRAMRLALADPLETLRLALLKVAFLWMPIDWEIRSPPGQLAPVYLFALPFAAVALTREPKRLVLFLVLLLGLTVFSMLVYGSPRLRFPYEPLVILLAATQIAILKRQALAWSWAIICFGLFLADDHPKLWLRGLASALGLW